jgi:hypothetical protein
MSDTKQVRRHGGMEWWPVAAFPPLGLSVSCSMAGFRYGVLVRKYATETKNNAAGVGTEEF